MLQVHRLCLKQQKKKKRFLHSKSSLGLGTATDLLNQSDSPVKFSVLI